MFITEKLVLLGLWPNPDARAWRAGNTGPRRNNYEVRWQALSYRGWVLGFYHHGLANLLTFTIIKDKTYQPLHHAARCVEIDLKGLNPLILPYYDPALFQPRYLSSYISGLPEGLRDRASHNITSWHKEIYHD